MDTLIDIFKNKTILCVEDDEIVLQQIIELCEEYFLKTFAATNGMDALKLYKKESPDIILTDISMPKLSGISFIKAIRERDTKTIVIFMTGYAHKENLIKLISLQVSAFLEKPFTINTLKNVMKKDLEKQKIIRINSSVTFHPNTLELEIDGTRIQLTPKESLLLELLAKNIDRIVSYETIKATLWSEEIDSDGALKTLLYRLRGKIGKEAIKSTASIGIQLNIAS